MNIDYSLTEITQHTRKQRRASVVDMDLSKLSYLDPHFKNQMHGRNRNKAKRKVVNAAMTREERMKKFRGIKLETLKMVNPKNQQPLTKRFSKTTNNKNYIIIRETPKKTFDESFSVKSSFDKAKNNKMTLNYPKSSFKSSVIIRKFEYKKTFIKPLPLDSLKQSQQLKESQIYQNDINNDINNVEAPLTERCDKRSRQQNKELKQPYNSLITNRPYKPRIRTKKSTKVIKNQYIQYI